MSRTMQNEIPHTHILELPQETVMNIFEYLTAADRRGASETCSSWFFAANIPRFRKRQYVTYDQDFEKSIIVNKNSSFCQQNYKFKNVDRKYLNEFADEWGQRMKSLVLLYTQSSRDNSCDMEFLKKCQNLEVLRINFNNLIKILEPLPTKLELPYLRTLDLAKNQNLSDALFDVLTRHAPNLEEIGLKMCRIYKDKQSATTDGGLCDTSLIPSRYKLRYSYLHRFLTLRASNIKHLNLANTSRYGQYIDTSFSKIENLHLLSLDFSCNLGHNNVNDKIFAIVKHQFRLKKLNLNLCKYLTDTGLEYISTHLPNLEDLSLIEAGCVTDLGIIELQKLKKLKSLNLSGCYQLTGDAFINGICRDTNLILKELNISYLRNVSENDLIIILKKLPNLRILNMGGIHFQCLTNKVIRTIIEHQPLLKVLEVDMCGAPYSRITDAGFTGVNYNTSMQNMKENNILSLAKLKELKTLNLNGLTKLTDRTLQNAIIFTKLENLNLSNCTSITHRGFTYLWKNCPNLETLNVSNCKIKDWLIIKLATNLKRLRTLIIINCPGVSDRAVKAINKIRVITCYKQII